MNRTLTLTVVATFIDMLDRGIECSVTVKADDGQTAAAVRRMPSADEALSFSVGHAMDRIKAIWPDGGN